MITLIHSAPKCGARVIQEPRGETLRGTLQSCFADADTLDPVTGCPGCGADLAEAYNAGRLVLLNPTGTATGQQVKTAGSYSPRKAAIALVRKSVREMKARQQARALA